METEERRKERDKVSRTTRRASGRNIERAGNSGAWSGGPAIIRVVLLTVLLSAAVTTMSVVSPAMGPEPLTRTSADTVYAEDQAIPPVFENPNFDDGASNWTLTQNAVWETTEVHSPPRSVNCKLEGTGGNVKQLADCDLPPGTGAKLRAYVKMPYPGSLDRKVFDSRTQGFSETGGSGDGTLYAGAWSYGYKIGPYPEWTLVEWDCTNTRNTTLRTRSMFLWFCTGDGPSGYSPPRPVYIDDVQVHFYPPHINSISPAGVSTGDTITISGVGYDFSQGTGKVKVGGVEATDVVSWGENKIKVKVPSGVISGNGSSGGGSDNQVVVKVTTAEGASNELNLTLGPPELDSVSPAEGPVGTQVTLKGDLFGAEQRESKVYFGSLEASTRSWSNGELTAFVPTGATSSEVRVETAGGKSNSTGVQPRAQDQLLRRGHHQAGVRGVPLHIEPRGRGGRRHRNLHAGDGRGEAPGD